MTKKFFETGFRLRKTEKDGLRARGLYVYDMRDCGRECSIEPSVAVDFLGTLITNFPIEFPTEGPLQGMVTDGYKYLRSVGAEEVYSRGELHE